jgi:hypothetical protein
MSPYLKGKKCRYIRGKLFYKSNIVRCPKAIIEDLNKVAHIAIFNTVCAEEAVFDGILINNKFIIFDIIPYKAFVIKRYEKRYKERVNDLGKLSLAIELLKLSHIDTICLVYFGNSIVQLCKNYCNLHIDTVLNCNEKYFKNNSFRPIKQNGQKLKKAFN